MKPLFVISGATASYKTSLAIDAAFYLQEKTDQKIEIINFDSLLFYKELNIGTAKPTVLERKGIPHHLIDIKSAHDPLSAFDYFILAKEKIQELHQNNIIPLLVGGSGLYLKVVLTGPIKDITPSSLVLERSNKLYKEEGITPFIEELKRVDQKRMEQLHPNDHYRIRRALEHYWQTGTSFFEFNEKLKAENATTPFYQKQNWDLLHLYSHVPKETHWKLIEQRARIMLEQGFIEEVKKLLESGLTKELRPMQSVGYKQVIDFLEGKISTKEELLEKIVIKTRQLAKAQKTWFKTTAPKTTFNPLSDQNQVFSTMLNHLTKK